MSIVAASVSALPETVGQTATGEWYTIDQQRIADFAETTEDRQWIHLDAERAAAGPFSTTIAHGYLTLSLLPHLTEGLLTVEGVQMAVNYGMDRVRFLQPVPSGGRVRATSEIVSAEQSGQGIRVGMRTTVELEGSDRPALVADTLALFVG